MSLQIAKAPYSVPFKKWVLSHLFPAEFSKYYTNIGAAVQAAIDETYEIDGVNIADGSYTLASNHIDPETIPAVNRSLSDAWTIRSLFSLVMVFLGLPSRATTIVYIDDASNQVPTMYFKQFGLNLIGGWDLDPKISLEKKIWQWLSLPIKIFVILPIKLLTFPIKLLINLLKLYAEWVPRFFATLSALALGAYRKTSLGSASFPSLNDWKNNPGLSFLLLFVVGFLKLPHLVLGTLYYAFKLVALIGQSIFSPEKGMRKAFNYGRELKIEFGESPAGKGFGHFISNVIGVLGALISLSITATFWIILLPLGLSFITAHVPVLVHAFTWFTQLPAVVATTTWFSQVSLITSSLGVAHGALTSLGLIISSVFGPTITTLGAVIGLKISVGVMITSTAIALIGAITTTALTKVGDFLSNLWASWTHGGPFTTLFSLCTPKSEQLIKAISVSSQLRGVPLTEEDRKNAVPIEKDYVEVEIDSDNVISQKAEKLGTKMTSSVERADEAASLSIIPKEYHRPSQQGSLKPAEDFADLYVDETTERYQSI